MKETSTRMSCVLKQWKVQNYEASNCYFFKKDKKSRCHGSDLRRLSNDFARSRRKNFRLTGEI